MAEESRAGLKALFVKIGREPKRKRSKREMFRTSLKLCVKALQWGHSELMRRRYIAIPLNVWSLGPKTQKLSIPGLRQRKECSDSSRLKVDYFVVANLIRMIRCIISPSTTPTIPMTRD